MRGKGEGGLYRVPADKRRPLKYWTATIELPPDADGNRRRKVMRSKDKAALVDKLADERAKLKERGDLPTADQSVAKWFTYWLSTVEREVRPKTFAGYRTVVTKHVVPVIGKVKLEKVTAATVRRVTSRITDDLHLSSTYALNAHRIMSIAFEAARREGRIGRNPTTLVNAPRKAIAPQEAFSVDEAIKVLEHVSHDSTLGARWATALLTGARRGEVIGLERDRVTDVLDLSWQLQRIGYSHGCDGTCGRRFGGDCPQRVIKVPADYEYRHIDGGLYWTRPKSSAGWRIIPLVDPLASILQRHLATAPQNQWGLVFTVDGKPIDPDRDTAAWKDVLAGTGVERDVVLHGLRHTAVDLLYLAGVPEDVIVQIVGHSSRSTTRGYQTRGGANRQRLDAAMHQLSALFTPQADATQDRPASTAE